MAFFDYFIHKKKKLKNLHDNILEFKIHFELKIILIQQLDEKDWLKLIDIEYIIYICLTIVGLLVYGS